MSKLLAGKSPSSPLVSNIWLLWQETHLALWPESIAPPQPAVQFLCLCRINLRLTHITPPKLPKLLVFRTDVSNPRSQVGVMRSVRVGLSSIMGTHSCVLSTICRNFCPYPSLTFKRSCTFQRPDLLAFRRNGNVARICSPWIWPYIRVSIPSSHNWLVTPQSIYVENKTK